MSSADKDSVSQRRRTYLYKLTSDRGGAPSAPQFPGKPDLLTLSICKPAIRRTAQVGDRILGLTSRALALSEGYPENAVIYAAIVGDAIDAREYYGSRSPFRHRPDCIYAFHRLNGTIEHSGKTPLHADPAYLSRDIGAYPYYKNGRTLLATEFRYFGSEAVRIPERLHGLMQLSEALGQGHRVIEHDGHPLEREVVALFKMLWKLPTRYTPAVVHEEAAGHTPKKRPVPAAVTS